MNPSPRVEGWAGGGDSWTGPWVRVGPPSTPWASHTGVRQSGLLVTTLVMWRALLPSAGWQRIPKGEGEGCMGYAPPSSWIVPQPEKVGAAEDQGVRDPKMVPVE